VFSLTNQLNLTYCEAHEGRISIAIDAWSSPNHKAFLAITVHLLRDGNPLHMVLDIIELAKVHTGRNMARAIVNTLEDFGITRKVC